MHGSWQRVPILYIRLPFPFQNCPFPLGDMDPHLINGSWGPPEFCCQTASRSVQLFLQGSWPWQTDRPCYSLSPWSGVNNLPTVATHCGNWESNSQPSSNESNNLSARLPNYSLWCCRNMIATMMMVIMAFKTCKCVWQQIFVVITRDKFTIVTISIPVSDPSSNDHLFWATTFSLTNGWSPKAICNAGIVINNFFSVLKIRTSGFCNFLY